ncbi:MAG: TonB-dependent receptor [Woeseiaceae bacterium]
MKFRSYVLLATLSIALPISPITAEEQSPIIVTATRTAQTVDESLASVTVITKEQIEQQQPDDIRALLTAVAGIDFTNNGGIGKATSIQIRGTSSSHVLVLIDGIRIGSATLGTASIQDIPVSQIERIEIVRGPRAALYGSGAIGGVIQIFTKKGSKEGLSTIEVGYGTYATSKISAGLSKQINDTSLSLSASRFKTDGFDAKDDTETDNDGYNNDSVTFNLKHKFDNKTSLSFNFMHAKGHTDFDGAYQNNSDFVQQTTGLKLNFAAMNNWNMHLSASQNLDEGDNFLNSTYKSTFNTNRTNASWQNDINFGDNQLLTFGVDYQNDNVSSSTIYNETSRNNTAEFIQHQWTGESDDLQVAIRNDKNQAFGQHTTGSIAYGHQFNTSMRLISSYGTAFKAPTFNNLYYPNSGNPDIKPEESESYEIELRGKHKISKWSVSIYHTNITNLIVYPPPTYAVTNLGNTVIDGIEFRLKTKIVGWDTLLDVTALDPRDKDTDKILQRRSLGSLKLSMDKTYNKWSSGFSYIGQQHRYNDTSNATRVSGYAIVNLRTRYAISKKLSIKAKLENIFDKDYETVTGYNNPGRSIFISVKYQSF